MQQVRRRRFVKLSILWMMLICSVVVLSACGGNQSESEEQENGQANIQNIPDDMIIARYEGGEVTGEEFKAYRGVTRLFVGAIYDQLEMMDPTINETLVSRIVAFETIENEADEQTRQEEEERAKQDLEDLSNYMTESSNEEYSLDTMLEEAGVTEEQLLDYLIQSNIVHAVMSQKIDDETIQAEYDRLNEEHYFDVATVRHILIGITNEYGEEIRTKEEALARAEEVIEKLENGESMEELAAQYSDDPGSKDNGGLYENWNVNEWTSQFRDAAIELPLNEISEPVETEYGYHVMRVEARETMTFEEVKEDVRASLAQDEITIYVEEVVPELIQEMNLPLEQS